MADRGQKDELVDRVIDLLGDLDSEIHDRLWYVLRDRLREHDLMLLYHVVGRRLNLWKKNVAGGDDAT